MCESYDPGGSELEESGGLRECDFELFIFDFCVEIALLHVISLNNIYF